ncbi:hypothetical protein TIFTF001_027448 [Ficus carica]|uniref:Uncharacterized protein n=1 Tax=Ficus carica TaxID=3494 RepID=A0AA88DN00_FICCA|nr:hypothetical protein TIFTF001_027448 [Ficus carica]
MPSDLYPLGGCPFGKTLGSPKPLVHIERPRKGCQPHSGIRDSILDVWNENFDRQPRTTITDG